MSRKLSSCFGRNSVPCSLVRRLLDGAVGWGGSACCCPGGLAWLGWVHGRGCVEGALCKARSTHGQHTVNTRSTRGQHTVNTRSTRKQICTFFYKKTIQNLYRGDFSGWGSLKYFLYLKCLIEAATLESSELYVIYIDSFGKTYITAYVLTVR